ncbi:MAG: RNA 2',3'-cyclic phosphodiesterase [Methanophagales archaeon]|nr:RNA 2',3'-cyclic phosphodiesterase [Methanophagales archaeon]
MRAMRVFIAIDLSEKIRVKIAEIQNEFAFLKVHSPGAAKFVDLAHAHQTVKFLGDVSEDDVERIKSGLAEITQKPFDIGLRGVGFFPAAPASDSASASSPEKFIARKIRVIWIGIREGKERLKALQEEVEREMHRLGFPREKRFSAHVTLCRVKKPLRSKNELECVTEKIVELRDVEVGKMCVEELKLKKSTLTPGGPIYEDLYVKRL